MSSMELQIGMPIILKNAKGLEAYPLWHNQEGMANTLVSVDGKDLVLFMPDNSSRMYYIEEDRIVINEAKIDEWRAANMVEVEDEH
jgi:hypothetical protein